MNTVVVNMNVKTSKGFRLYPWVLQRGHMVLASQFLFEEPPCRFLLILQCVRKHVQQCGLFRWQQGLDWMKQGQGT